ncbi:MAG: ABC transporter permease [Gemmatimonadales bacterium]
MSIHEWWRRIGLLLHRDRATRELEEEMRLHREHRAEQLRAQGMTPAEAEFAARRRFGNQGVLQEASRDAWGFRWIDDAVQDIRYAARRLRQRPGFTFAVVGILALGTGATTAMFSAVDAAMLRPLPFLRPAELVALPQVRLLFDDGMGHPGGITIADVEAMPRLFSHASAWGAGGLNLSDPDHPLRLNVGVVTTDFFTTIGTPPLVGRGFVPEEGRFGNAQVAVLSYGLWQRQYGGRDMIGHAILLSDKSYIVIGVMPPGFSFPQESDLWIPMTIPATYETFEPFHGGLLTSVIARLAPGVDVRTAATALFGRWQAAIDAEVGHSPDPTTRQTLDKLDRDGAVQPLQQSLVGDRRTALLVLLGATGLLLLIACANVTNLLLSQAVTRRREIAVREVLGATRGRVVRQLLAESVLLTLAGAALGILLAPLSLGLLRTLLPAGLAGLATARIDARILAFTVLLGAASGVIFGLWPALATSGKAPVEVIKQGGGHGATAGRTGQLRRSLVAAELALTVVLLVGAGLMLRSFSRLMGLDRGMNVENVGTLEVSQTFGPARSSLRLLVIDQVLARLQATPGIVAAGAVNDLPLGGEGGLATNVSIDGASDDIPSMPYARILEATDDYFAAMGIRLLAGRTFAASDDSLAPPVMIISAHMAEEDWPGVNAVGRTFHVHSDALYTVIGIVSDVRELRLDENPMPQMYSAITQGTPGTVTLVARGALAPNVLLATMQAAVRAVDPSQAVYHVRMMNQVLNTSVAPRRTNTILISLFAAVALVLASFGVYAVVAYGVAQRFHEFGIRSALGATGRDLIGLVSREMVWVAVLGLAVGLGGAWALMRIANSLIYGVTIHDPVTFVLAPVLLLVPVVMATLIPARRAARVDPAEVMRAD